VLAKGRMRPTGRMFDMPGFDSVNIIWDAEVYVLVRYC
jgi:hypothetical protein